MVADDCNRRNGYVISAWDRMKRSAKLFDKQTSFPRKIFLNPMHGCCAALVRA